MTYDEAIAAGGKPVAQPSGKTPCDLAIAAGGKEVSAPQVTQAESAVRGGLQGATMGFGDEIAAAIDSAASRLPGVITRHLPQDKNLPPLTDSNITYAQRRDAYRAKNAAAQDANPLTYLGGQLAGSVAIPVPGAGLKGAAGVARLAGIGGVSSLGASNADLTKGDVGGALTDTATGAGVGLLTGGAMAAAPKILGAIGTGAPGVKEVAKKVGHELIEGHPLGAVTAGATGAARIAAQPMASSLARIADAAAKGNPVAIRLMAAAQQVPGIASRLASLNSPLLDTEEPNNGSSQAP